MKESRGDMLDGACGSRMMSQGIVYVLKNRKLLEKFSMLIEIIKQRKNDDAEERRFN